jgi:hypothetical protein
MTLRALLLFGILAGVLPAAADPKAPTDRVYRLQWRDLSRITRGRNVRLTLPSGIRLRGMVIAVEPEELVLDVRKTSDKHSYPKGRAVVPRPEVTRLRVDNSRHTWRSAGLGIGLTAGALVGIPLALYEAKAGAVALSIIVPTGVGYLLGWAADRKVTEILVEPDPGEPPSPRSP